MLQKKKRDCEGGDRRKDFYIFLFSLKNLEEVPKNVLFFFCVLLFEFLRGEKNNKEKKIIV